MGGREVGGLANQLAAHMRFDQPGAIDRVRRFWDAPAHGDGAGPEGGRPVRGGARRPHQGASGSSAPTRPTACPAPTACAPRCEACPFVVVSDIWPTDTTRYAHVVLPAAGWGERSGTVTNSERRITRQRAFRDAARRGTAGLVGVGPGRPPHGLGRRLRLAQRRPRCSASTPP